jgi:hypothetical protein
MFYWKADCVYIQGNLCYDLYVSIACILHFILVGRLVFLPPNNNLFFIFRLKLLVVIGVLCIITRYSAICLILDFWVWCWRTGLDIPRWFASGAMQFIIGQNTGNLILRWLSVRGSSIPVDLWYMARLSILNDRELVNLPYIPVDWINAKDVPFILSKWKSLRRVSVWKWKMNAEKMLKEPKVTNADLCESSCCACTVLECCMLQIFKAVFWYIQMCNVLYTVYSAIL